MSHLMQKQPGSLQRNTLLSTDAKNSIFTRNRRLAHSETKVSSRLTSATTDDSWLSFHTVISHYTAINHGKYTQRVKNSISAMATYVSKSEEEITATWTLNL